MYTFVHHYFESNVIKFVDMCSNDANQYEYQMILMESSQLENSRNT